MSVALKERMLFNVQNDVKIAGWAAEKPGFPLSGIAHAHPLFNTCRNFDFKRTLFYDAALALALRAGIVDDLSRTAAGSTGPRNREKSLLVAYLAATATGFTTLS